MKPLTHGHLLKVLPTRNEKKRLCIIEMGCLHKRKGNIVTYKTAQAMRLEIDPYDRSFISYNTLIHTSNGEHKSS